MFSDGFGGWVSRGSPPVGELPCVARYWSRGFVEEPTGYWSVGRPGGDWSIVCVLPRLPFTSTRVSVLGDLFNAFACVCHVGVGDWQRLTLYWPYCRSVRVEGFAPRNPILPWVGAVLSRCRRLRCLL